MAKSGWHCTYTAPSRAGERRPFDPRKLEDIAVRVCRLYGPVETMRAARAGVDRCIGAQDPVCETIAKLYATSRNLDQLFAEVGLRQAVEALAWLADIRDELAGYLGQLGLLIPEFDPAHLVRLEREIVQGAISDWLLSLSEAEGCVVGDGDFSTGGSI